MSYLYKGATKIVSVNGSAINLISGNFYPKIVRDSFPVGFDEKAEPKAIKVEKPIVEKVEKPIVEKVETTDEVKVEQKPVAFGRKAKLQKVVK